MRRLTADEIESVLQVAVPGTLATLDKEGYPYLTPIWFVHDPRQGVVMTSLPQRPHVMNLKRDPRAAFVVDLEGPQSSAGRPNVQVKGRGEAHLDPDHHAWTRAITQRYGGSADLVSQRATVDRVAIFLRPRTLMVRLPVPLRLDTGGRASRQIEPAVVHRYIVVDSESDTAWQPC